MEHNLIPLNGSERRPVQSPQLARRWIGAAVLAAGILAALGWFLQEHRSAAVPTETRKSVGAVRVTVQTAALTASPQSLEVTGTVRSEFEASLASKVMARVQSVLVQEGDTVRRGEPVILLEARDLQASVSQADAGLRAARAGYDTARVAARMEALLSTARTAEARSRIGQTEAALSAAGARLELVQAGPRPQERVQALLAVTQARASLSLAQSSLQRMASLYRDGAISALQYDQYQAQFAVAKSQYETAQQAKSLTDEGSRAEEIRAAQQAVLQAQAAVQEANAGLKSAQAGALQTQVRQQEIQGAQAQIGRSQAGVQLAQVTRDDAVIRAPFDAVVTRRLADPGVLASPGVLLLTVGGGALRLEAIVPESALGSVRKGAAVPVQLDALQNRALTGRVVEIAPQGDAGSHTFVVKIGLPRRSGAAAGMFGRARFTTGSEQGLCVPASAVWEREGLHYLYVVDENHTARLRMVTTGDPVGEKVPVLSGLSAGERIVTAGRELLSDGAPVTEEAR